MAHYHIKGAERTLFGITEDEPHRFTAEASTLGWRPGEWPNVIDTDMGNGRPLVFSSRQEQDGDLVSVTYRQELGCMFLKVWND